MAAWIAFTALVVIGIVATIIDTKMVTSKDAPRPSRPKPEKDVE